MLYNMFHGKIHRATVTQANLEYMEVSLLMKNY